MTWRDHLRTFWQRRPLQPAPLPPPMLPASQPLPPTIPPAPDAATVQIFDLASLYAMRHPEATFTDFLNALAVRDAQLNQDILLRRQQIAQLTASLREPP